MTTGYNIVDRTEVWIRNGMRTTPEREAWAGLIMAKAAKQALTNWVPADRAAADAARPPVTLSSAFRCGVMIHGDLTGAPKEPVAPRALDAFGIGQMVEAMAVSKCILANMPVAWPNKAGEQYRGHVDFGGDSIRGSVDMVLDVDGVMIPVEIKSMADYGWDTAKKTGKIEDTFGYVTQLQHYIAMLKAPYGIFLAVKKSTGHCLQETVVADPSVLEASRATYAAAKAGRPERPEWAKTQIVKSPGGTVERISDVRCGYCPRIEWCWGSEYVPAVVSGKPVRQRPLQTSKES